MIKPVNAFASALLMGLLLATVYGCEKKEGPVEKAGKEVDKAVITAGQKIEKAGDNIQDAAKGDKK
jgi:hypothetical protein